MRALIAIASDGDTSRTMSGGGSGIPGVTGVNLLRELTFAGLLPPTVRAASARATAEHR